MFAQCAGILGHRIYRRYDVLRVYMLYEKKKKNRMPNARYDISLKHFFRRIFLRLL